MIQLFHPEKIYRFMWQRVSEEAARTVATLLLFAFWIVGTSFCFSRKSTVALLFFLVHNLGLSMQEKALLFFPFYILTCFSHTIILGEFLCVKKFERRFVMKRIMHTMQLKVLLCFVQIIV